MYGDISMYLEEEIFCQKMESLQFAMQVKFFNINRSGKVHVPVFVTLYII
jgi:hypothetical protein